MEKNEPGVFDLIEGLKEVKEEALAEYNRLIDEAIPEIVKVVEERRLAAAKSRHCHLKL